MMTCTQRTAWPRQTTELAQERERCLRAGVPVLDLSCSNPPRLGFRYDAAVLSQVYAQAGSYEPAALGRPEARDAIVQYLRKHGATVSAGQVWIGAGTSELYSHVMSLFCDPGDVWLVPRPGYPLFSYVADLQGVRMETYPLSWDGTWHLRAQDLREALAGSGCKVLVIISPHNPTGHVWSDAERDMVVACCAEYGVVLVVDEVFLDYPAAGAQSLPSIAGETRCLTVCLSGISKVAAFPQGKLAWAVVSGPGADECLARAELVADTYLSTSTVIQLGLPALLREAPRMQQSIRGRCRTNQLRALELLEGTAISVCETQAGWTQLLRLPRLQDDAVWALRILQEQQVFVQPGYLFEMEAAHAAPFVAISLLVEPAVLAEGLQRVVQLVEKEAA